MLELSTCIPQPIPQHVPQPHSNDANTECDLHVFKFKTTTLTEESNRARWHGLNRSIVDLVEVNYGYRFDLVCFHMKSLLKHKQLRTRSTTKREDPIRKLRASTLLTKYTRKQPPIEVWKHSPVSWSSAIERLASVEPNDVGSIVVFLCTWDEYKEHQKQWGVQFPERHIVVLQSPPKALWKRRDEMPAHVYFDHDVYERIRTLKNSRVGRKVGRRRVKATSRFPQPLVHGFQYTLEHFRAELEDRHVDSQLESLERVLAEEMEDSQ